MVILVGRVDRIKECEVVSSSSRTRGISTRTRRPIVAVEASEPKSTSSHGRVNEPAAHEVFVILFTTARWEIKNIRYRIKLIDYLFLVRTVKTEHAILYAPFAVFVMNHSIQKLHLYITRILYGVLLYPRKSS